VCVTKVAMTDGLDVTKSKTILKVDVGATLEAAGAADLDESTKMMRVPCKITSGKDKDKEGWVSVKSTSGTVFLQTNSPINQFTQDLEEKAKGSDKVVAEALGILRKAIGSIPVTASTPLRNAKGELQKLTGKVQSENGKIAGMRQKIAASKRMFLQKEEAERKAAAEKKAPKAAPPKPALAKPSAAGGEVAGKGPAITFDAQKPIYVCAQGLELQGTFESAGAEVLRKLAVDELVEVLEEPKEEVAVPALRAGAKAVSDSKTGFFDVRDGASVVYAEVGSFHICTGTVALTDSLDVRKGKVIRKLTIGEVLRVVEGPTEDGDSKIVRYKGKALKDDVEGWVTPKGNAGSVYTKESTKHYSVLKAVPLEKTFAGGGEPIRELQEGEVVEVTQGPREAKVETVHRLRCKAVGDGKEGWCTLRPGLLLPGAKQYISLRAVALRETKAEDGKEVRSLEVGEELELLEGPVEGPGDALWIKVKFGSAKKPTKKNSGWAPLRDAKGRLLQPCLGSTA